MVKFLVEIVEDLVVEKDFFRIGHSVCCCCAAVGYYNCCDKTSVVVFVVNEREEG